MGVEIQIRANGYACREHVEAPYGRDEIVQASMRATMNLFKVLKKREGMTLIQYLVACSEVATRLAANMNRRAKEENYGFKKEGKEGAKEGGEESESEKDPYGEDYCTT